jgi:hypothetical protein
MAESVSMETRTFLEPSASLLTRLGSVRSVDRAMAFDTPYYECYTMRDTLYRACYTTRAVAPGRSARCNCASRHTDLRDLCASGATCPKAVDDARDRGDAAVAAIQIPAKFDGLFQGGL